MVSGQSRSNLLAMMATVSVQLLLIFTLNRPEPATLVSRHHPAWGKTSPLLKVPEIFPSNSLTRSQPTSATYLVVKVSCSRNLGISYFIFFIESLGSRYKCLTLNKNQLLLVIKGGWQQHRNIVSKEGVCGSHDLLNG